MAKVEREESRKMWRCFFCDEVFRSRKAAYLHFGEENCETDPPACVDPLRSDEKARLKELRDARDYAAQCRDESQRIEERMDGLLAEHDNFFRYFGPDCRTMWQAADRYNNAVYELGLLRSKPTTVDVARSSGQTDPVVRSSSDAS